MWFRKRRDSDFHAEIESHMQLEADRLIAEGMTAAHAHAAARRAFGNVAVVQETFYQSQRWMWFSQLGRDLRYGLRIFRKSPALTAAAALTISLGLGASTAVFSLVDVVLLQSLAVDKPQELAFIKSGGVAPSSTPPYPCLARLPEGTGSFAGLAVFATDEMRVEIDGRPEAVLGQVASGNYFELLGVKPSLGRLMENRDGKFAPRIAVIGDGYWQRRFNRDPGVLGKQVIIGNRAFTIAGVAPAEFTGLDPGRPIDVTIPIDTDDGIQTYTGPWWFEVIARLKPGVPLSSAHAAANGFFQSCMSGSGIGSSGLARLEFQSAAHGSSTLRSRFSKPLFALIGIALLVLLLATVNIANLLLVRAIGRSREFAIRLATGASRWHIVRQTLTETLMLFGLGVVPGILFAGWGAAAVTALFAQGRRPITLDTSLNWRVLAFSISVTLVAGALSSLLPALRIFRTDPQRSISEGHARNSESRGTALLMRSLVGVQIALSLVPLVGAITFARSLANLHNVDPGFRNVEVLTMSIELPPTLKPGEAGGLWTRVLAAVRETPGVSSAALCRFTPLSGRDSGATTVRIRGFEPANIEDSTVRINQVSDGYFETLGIRLLRGRLLADRDREGTLPVAVIDESAARRFFGDVDAIGQSLEFPRKGLGDASYRIVGVVGDTKHRDLREVSPRFAYIPIRQPLTVSGRFTLTVASAAPGGQTALLESIRSRIGGVHSGLLISEVITIRRQLDSTLFTERLLSGLSTTFGVLALILASVGLYGVMSYRIGQQRQSIGIQMALGATTTSVAFGVLRQSGWIIGVGLLAGLPIAYLAARLADSLLWGVKSDDPGSYLMAGAALGMVGLVSGWLTARRASAIEPAEALRHS